MCHPLQWGGMAVDGEAEIPPSVVVDRAGRVQTICGPWFGQAAPDCVGDPFGTLFEGDSRRDVDRCLGQGWLGHEELQPTLVGGRSVVLAVGDVEVGWRVELRDTTTARLLHRAAEQQCQLETIAHLAGSVARELTDPMTILQGRLELMLDLGVSDPESVRRHIELALDHAHRVTATLRNLRLVGRAPTSHLEPVPLRHAVDDALDLLGARKTRVGIDIHPLELEVSSDRPILSRVIASLIRASLEAAGRSGVTLGATRRPHQVDLRIGPVGRPRGRVFGDHQPGHRSHAAGQHRGRASGVGGEIGSALRGDPAPPRGPPPATPAGGTGPCCWWDPLRSWRRSRAC